MTRKVISNDANDNNQHFLHIIYKQVKLHVVSIFIWRQNCFRGLVVFVRFMVLFLHSHFISSSVLLLFISLVSFLFFAVFVAQLRQQINIIPKRKLRFQGIK